jgi:hypothetical protein
MSAQVTPSSYFQIIDTLAAIAEKDRQFREIKHFVDRSLDSLKKFWLVAPLAAAAWVYVVSDEERFKAVAGAGDHLLDMIPMEDVQRWLAA